jgi:hypothetical protein
MAKLHRNADLYARRSCGSITNAPTAFCRYFRARTRYSGCGITARIAEGMPICARAGADCRESLTRRATDHQVLITVGMLQEQEETPYFAPSLPPFCSQSINADRRERQYAGGVGGQRLR